MMWKDDRELFNILERELFTALVGDALDKAGFHKQFLPPEIKPLAPTMVVAGRVMPVVEADYLEASSAGFPSQNPSVAKPVGLMFGQIRFNTVAAVLLPTHSFVV